MIFWKTNNNGNDFIISLVEDKSVDYQKESVKLCQRTYSVGADGVIILVEEHQAYKAYFYNADGSRAKICGNGLLCIGEILKRFSGKNEAIINTYGGQAEISFEDNFVCVKMPLIVKELPFSKSVGGVHFTMLDVGNNHAIARVMDVNKINLEYLAEIVNREFEGNVSIISLENHGEFRIRTYERGVGETNSCGSAAVASFYLLTHLGMVLKNVVAKSRGGTLFLSMTRDDRVILKGTPKIVYKGELIDD